MMDGLESTSRNILQKVGSATCRSRKESETEETNNCDQEVRAINTQRSIMNMKQEGPFLGEKSRSKLKNNVQSHFEALYSAICH